MEFKIGGNLGVSQLTLCAACWILTDGFVLTGLDLTVDGFWFLQEFGESGHCKRYIKFVYKIKWLGFSWLSVPWCFSALHQPMLKWLDLPH